ncbi:hypothetical protein ERJ75_000978300 [Trypanosoma vivax]|uniref:Uncharacterized protein n=1 Tax=Trypanosoma vivax (strain Y486) TaxID=1055687 RepID=G0U6S8_TRYVY|nr:hypothetical protein TRVL_02673 [Trypanosoma vivax]KAH8611685.1 hypothetical protein ERJ75_000978300 [Trypanosoma vivax]CCC51583.1 conserved hypothetical protein [Trypanosoma vivax Y486]
MDTLIETFNDSSAYIRSLYEKIKTMSDDPRESEAKVDALRVLHDCFAHHTATMRGEMDILMTAEEQQALCLEEEVEELEARLEVLSRITEGCDATGRPLPNLVGDSATAYKSFVVHLIDLSAQLTVTRDALQHLLSFAPLQLVENQSIIARLGVTSKETWSIKESELNSSWESLRRKAAVADVSMEEVTVIAAQNLFCTVMELGKRAVSAVAASTRADAERTKELELLSHHQQRLVLWCRQQQANLDVLEEPDHVQEFCSSLLEHYKTMSENFRIVLELAEPYLDDGLVQEWLLEANETWLHLQVKTLERLRAAVLEVDLVSLLEEHVERQHAFCLKIGAFLEELESALGPRCDADFPSCRRCDQLLLDCRELRLMMPEYENLTKRLLEFSERAKVDRLAYDCYRQAALSHVTYLSSSSDVAEEASHRKGVFKACVDELQTWAMEKARCVTWHDIRDKVRNIKLLLEREQLFST